MSAKTRGWIGFTLVFAAIIAAILVLNWSAWSDDPSRALIWCVEVGLLIGLSLLFAPLIFRIVKVVMWCYIKFGTFLARLILGNRAAQAAEQGVSLDDFLHKPLFRVYLRWMRFGDDREKVDNYLAPAQVSTWIIFGWPLAVLPLIFEETLPIFLIVLGLAPFAARHYARRRGEVESVIHNAFEAKNFDSSSTTE
ncbi:MAG TPA: hypothetical protein VLE72_03285 [Candidatus Saccharimonadales bacterium]|nr:hypothetical protein [Candidatus Saccharimonadales bacterium]